MPFTTLVPSTTITSSWANANVRDQVITPFASVAARDSAITAPVNGQYCTTTDTGSMWRYNGAKWLRQEEFVIKTADTAFASLTTLTDDPALLFPVDINSTYLFEIEILWSAAATPKYAYAIRFPAGCRMDYSRSVLDASGVTLRDAQVNVASGTGTTSGPTANGTGATTFRGTIVTGATSGSVVFQAAQSVSSATTCTTQRGSFIRYRQVA
jgi:hypothetical protein